MPQIITDSLIHLSAASFGGLCSIAVVWIVCRVFRRLTASLRCWLWWLACLKLLLGLVSLPELKLPAIPVAAIIGYKGRSVPHELQPAASAPPTAIDSSAAESSGNSVTSTSGLPSATGNSQRFNAVSAVAGLWLLGIGVGIGVQMMALVQLRRLTATGVRLETPLMEVASRRAGLRSVPPLYVLSASLEPLVVANGLRPVILVAGQDLERLGADEQLALFTHECVHIRRGDLWLSVVPWLAGTVFWFLPPVYAALREFQIAREAACDQDTVAALALRPRAYAELLIKLSSPSSHYAAPLTVAALSAGYRGLKRRIEMLNGPATRRSSAAFLVLAAVVGASVVLPWRLTANASVRNDVPALDPTASVTTNFPNLGLSNIAGHWKRTALGSDTELHPFFALGVDPAVTCEGKPSAFVRCRETSFVDPDTDGGVLRFDLEDAAARKYLGKRIRLSASVRGDGLTKQAFLFIAAETDDKSRFATSANLAPRSPKSGEWRRLSCVMDVTKDTEELSLGLRLEGRGTAYGSRFALEVVDKTVPVTPLKVTETYAPPHNLTFKDSLSDWWNDNPTQTAESEYQMRYEANGGRTGAAAASLTNSVPKPSSYGTIAQNAGPGAFRGKRIRFSAWMKTKDADKAELWIVVSDKRLDNTSGANGDSTGQFLHGTHGWTKREYTIDVPETANLLSFGISSTGKGKVWVDGFHFEVVEPVKK